MAHDQHGEVVLGSFDAWRESVIFSSCSKILNIFSRWSHVLALPRSPVTVLSFCVTMSRNHNFSFEELFNVEVREELGYSSK